MEITLSSKEWIDEKAQVLNREHHLSWIMGIQQNNTSARGQVKTSYIERQPSKGSINSSCHVILKFLIPITPPFSGNVTPHVKTFNIATSQCVNKDSHADGNAMVSLDIIYLFTKFFTEEELRANQQKLESDYIPTNVQNDQSPRLWN